MSRRYESKYRNTKKIRKKLWRFFNPLSTNPTKWSNTLKQFAGNLPTNCFSVFDHFMKLALKGLIQLRNK